MYDWVKDATPQEEAEMKAQGWDTEQTKLGPVKQRYRQPALIIDEAAHERVKARAHEVLRKLEAHEEDLRVCCFTVASPQTGTV